MVNDLVAPLTVEDTTFPVAAPPFVHFGGPRGCTNQPAGPWLWSAGRGEGQQAVGKVVSTVLGLVQILLRFGALFATPFSAHLFRILAHSVRTFCAFYAFSELSAKCSGCTGLLTEPLGLAWLSTEMVHLLCILRAFTNPNAECVPNARESTQNGTG